MQFKFPAFIYRIKSSEEKAKQIEVVGLIQKHGIVMHSRMHLQLTRSVAVKMLLTSTQRKKEITPCHH